jgi:hypothetical protein
VETRRKAVIEIDTTVDEIVVIEGILKGRVTKETLPVGRVNIRKGVACNGGEPVVKDYMEGSSDGS